jgi:hypothetical protein
VNEASREHWKLRAERVRVRSAIEPLLWATGIATPTHWFAAYLFRDDSILKYAFITVGALPIVATLVSYFYFLFRDPDRLQTKW